MILYSEDKIQMHEWLVSELLIYMKLTIYSFIFHHAF